MPSRGRERGRAVEVAPRPARRSVRVRRDSDSPDGEGPILIRAVVHARLLGLRILTLDARVVVAEPGALPPALRGLGDADPARMPIGYASGTAPRYGGDVLAPLALVDAARHGGGVGEARELLAQGADTLAGLRRE